MNCIVSIIIAIILIIALMIVLTEFIIPNLNVNNDDRRLNDMDKIPIQ
jgi:hypothetical protein